TLSIHPKGLHGTYRSQTGRDATWSGTNFIIGLQHVGTEPLYVEHGVSVINRKDKKKTRKCDSECEFRANKRIMNEAMCLAELLDPKKGFIINDILYIKVEICAMKIIKYTPAAPTPMVKTTQSTGKKEVSRSSAETTTQSEESKSTLNKNPGEDQETKATNGKRNFSLSRWFHE
ncbi:hypothetical protein MKW94_020752, partial [Papaver nudicaule]|nr:hypothetical protein [Papaver nudicaule]